jgi:hypothetical protein
MGLSAEGAASVRLRSVSWSGQHVVLVSLLIVCVPVTASWSTLVAVLVVPVTLVVAVGFWHASRRRVGFWSLVRYSVVGGAISGAIDAGLCYSVVLGFSHGSLIRTAFNFPIAGLVGVLLGVAYGLGFLPLLLLQASIRGLLRTEGIDRCLIGCGLWGLVVGQLGFNVQPHLSRFIFEIQPALNLSWAAMSFIHGLMLALGFIPWAGRRLWLQRVASGKVPGWQLCSVDDFGAGAVAALPLFCKPLVARAKRARVLARSRSGDVYRGETLEPKYLVP